MSINQHPKQRSPHENPLLKRARNNAVAWAATFVVTLAGVGSAPVQAQGELNRESAQVLVSALYGALVSSNAEEIERVLTRIATPRWQNCGDNENENCETLSETIERWSRRSSTIANARSRWPQKEVLIVGNRIVVRGQFSGTPIAPFPGIAPNGRSFSLNTMDIHEVRNGRVVRTYHLENLASATEQLSAERWSLSAPLSRTGLQHL